MLLPDDSGRGIFQRKGLVRLRLKDSYDKIFSGIKQPRDCFLECGSAWNDNVVEII